MLRQWLTRKWQRETSPDLVEDYRAIFASVHGQRILQHWLDQIYCTVYEGTDVQQLWMHNARRAFVQEILEAIDLAEHPKKYDVKEG